MPLPTPGAGELLVRVAAAGLNPIDCRIRSGELRHFLRVGLPFVSGSDIAGIVEAAGPGANRFHAGDAVFAMLPVKAGGGYAEYALVRETMAAPALELLGGWIAEGRVRPHVERSYPLAEAADAQRLSEAGRVRGKLVLIVDGPLAGQRPPSAEPDGVMSRG